MMVIWQVWNMRNIWVCEKKIDHRIMCDKTMRLLGEYECGDERESEQGTQMSVGGKVWRPPSNGRWKVNTDATLNGSIVGMGMVVRDVIGDVVMTAGCNTKGVIPSLQAEDGATLFGTRYAFDAGYRAIEFVSDCLTLISLLKGKGKDNTTV